jgi:hypothetical protein
VGGETSGPTKSFLFASLICARLQYGGREIGNGDDSGWRTHEIRVGNKSFVDLHIEMRMPV